MEQLGIRTIVRISPDASEDIYKTIGADIMWVHTGKIWDVSSPERVQFSERQIHSQLDHILASGKKVCIDIVSPARTICWSEALSMPNGDLYRDLREGYRFNIVGNDTSDEKIKQLDYLFTLPVLKVTALPLSDRVIRSADEDKFFVDESTGLVLPRLFYFGDEEVVIEIQKIHQFESRQLINAEVLLGGRLWGQRMKMNALDLEITEFTSVPTQIDLDILDAIPSEMRQRVDSIALSFATAGSIDRLQDILDEKGFCAHIIAKIESREGVLRIEEILDRTGHIMIALGDLGVVCGLEGWDIDVVVEYLFRKVSQRGIKRMYIASGFADSLRNASVSAALSNAETAFMNRIIRLSNAYQMEELVIGLTRETFTVDPHLAVSIESRVRSTIESILFE